jgi:hypothetical protein
MSRPSCPSTSMPKHRYTHCIYPVKGDRQPSRFIALAVATTLPRLRKGQTRREPKLSRWAVETWSCRAGREGTVRAQTGQSLAGLWDVLAAPLSLPGTTWLVCSPAVQVAALIGVFTRLDEGSLAWGMDEEGEVDHDGPGKTYKSAGQCSLEDPPTLLDLKVPGRAGTLRIVDVRNWGVQLCASDGRLDAAARALGEGIRSVVAACAERQLGSLQPTAAAQAWYSFRRSYVRHKIMVHNRPECLWLERASLAGGRTECYRLGRVGVPVYQCDFSSHYCSILRDVALPVRLRYHGGGDGGLLRAEIGERRGIVAQCKVRTDWPEFPHCRDGVTIYPVGTFWTVLTGPDLYPALDSGRVLAWGAWASYDLERAFRDWASSILSWRSDAKRDGNRALEDVAKALGVSLVGKFAQRGRHWEDTGRRDEGERWYQRTYHDGDGKTVPVRCLSGRLQRQVDHGETRESMPALAAYVYAEGRRRLWGAQLVAGRDEVYYSCVDSLFCSRLGYERLQVSGLLGSGQPGSLRLVEVHDWMEVYGLNHWRTPSRYVAAGVPRSGPSAWMHRKARTQVGEGRAPTAEEYLAHVERISPYRHGVRGADGRVSPWVVEEG